ncbi:MAG: DNA polymerase III subunit gamma/tau [Planctomycetes bacterium]|nr:DNA polymerase III subunit gamma/tau [Planctomycetota bacterium]
MSYTALARKYRSRTFTEVIGQEPIAKTLANAIRASRVHHGYLFTGTRGSGKTSMARILAKSLNCLKSDGPTVDPCLECDACRLIADGQDMDVVEIDAASNTGVDNIRELRSNAAYRPARCRFKIYIIDEVHMLSTGAFNALLKTLEEPPDHVKFILATTEFQKVPATIRSRCQCFYFRNIPPEAIAERLAKVAESEGAAVEAAVTRRVARLANGSMRDALSILDQLLAVSPTEVTAAVLDEILPPAQDEQVFKLLRCVAAGDVPNVLAALDSILGAGRSIEHFCGDAVEILHTLMHLRACGPDATTVDIPAGGREEYVKLSQSFELSQYVQMIAMLEELRRNVRYSGSGRALADALILRLAKLREWTPIERILANLGDTGEKKKTLAAPPTATVPKAPSPAPPLSSDKTAVVAGPRSTDRAKLAPRTAAPPAVVAERSRAGATEIAPTEQPDVVAAYGELAQDGEPQIIDHDGLPLPAGDERDFSNEEVEGASSEKPFGESENAGSHERAHDALARGNGSFARSVSSEEKAQISKDPVVSQVIDLFSGVLVNIQKIDPL